MLLSNIVNRINKLLSNNTSFHLNYDRIGFYLDLAVDNINQRFNTSFKTFSDYYSTYAFYFSSLKKIQTTTDYLLGPSIVTDDIASVDLSTYEQDTGGKNMFFYFPNQDIFKMLVWDKDNGGEPIWSPNEYTLNTTGWAPSLIITNDLMPYIDYVELPDRYIRNCIIYYAAALYLEEEDELEGQYKMYMAKVEKELAAWDREYFRCYSLNNTCCHNKELNKHKLNPYWINCGD